MAFLLITKENVLLTGEEYNIQLHSMKLNSPEKNSINDVRNRRGLPNLLRNFTAPLLMAGVLSGGCGQKNTSTSKDIPAAKDHHSVEAEDDHSDHGAGGRFRKHDVLSRVLRQDGC